MTLYDDEIQQALRDEIAHGRVVVFRDVDSVFVRLSKSFPANDYGIDWARLPEAVHGRVAASELQDQIQEFTLFLKKVIPTEFLAEKVLYVGDSATDIGVEGAFSDVLDALPVLLEVPQHHYIVDHEFRWCANWSMLDEISFAWSPGQARG